MDIHWYPGHMTKTRRMIQADLKLVDLVAEVIDARIPISSRNPDIDELVGDKPRLIILNRADQADPEQTRAWTRWFKARGCAVLETDSKTGGGVNQFSAVIKDALKEQIARWREKGQVGRPVRVMVVGVPNVGKSTFINKVARRKSAKAGDRPGVTRGKQWVAVDAGLDLLDTPGILWPKFEDQTVGRNLAFTGAIKDEVMDAETLACYLMETLAERYPQALLERYKLELPPRAQDEETGGLSYGYDLLERAARKRGFLISGGEPDTERMAKVLLDEFRAGRLGRFTLETPEGAEAYGDG
ncbi:ribosome biogenesis GTPase YlqF [Intestinimonas massiliensis]|jgi:ribosome biogenesis GTPase A|uniref:Ribosome biogenesis GTPase A n=1 Tax=Intestinimonas massiliensis (ex Afouda et al. 2020) TaxID=1673721 RepID=A0ABS9M616_9FIRM|nr:ribosome biogenesis GTPase YlqF [Intestinimonas massiliensis (ex Afouda et al. 2020)]MCG4526238.1 ribosome biogenesis GTPase YlqF [Intestinimonas massiliensis (ex Afouda et al. 2020)]MCQ4805961.1 ribosome biogenesis GTPase YlqF [Intestinimonas massiliensis (ex Afouda et al. 2020)]